METDDEGENYTEEEKEEMEKTFPFTIKVGDEIVFKEKHYPVTACLKIVYKRKHYPETACSKLFQIYEIESRNKETKQYLAVYLHAPPLPLDGCIVGEYSSVTTVHLSKPFWDTIELYRDGERVYFSSDPLMG